VNLSLTKSDHEITDSVIVDGSIDKNIRR